MTKLVETSQLTAGQIPPDTAGLDDLITFAHTFDGYQHAGSFERCARIANDQVFRSTDDLRAALFFEVSKWRHFGQDPDLESLAYWRSLVSRIRRRLEVIDSASPEWLAAAIKPLPSEEPVPKGTQGFNLYQTQKDHWLGWLDPSAGTGTYPRQTGAEVPARTVYNRIMEPKMLLWLASAAGVSSGRVAEASTAAAQHRAFASKCAAVRKLLPWRVVADLLMADTDRSPDIDPEVSDLQNGTPAETLEPLLLKTARRWNIPTELVKEVIRRDAVCVYCRQTFVGPDGPARSRASWEHIVNDLTLITSANIALCCVGCNASKGTLTLRNWLTKEYCSSRRICESTMADVAVSAVGAN
jgi:hypothetical protein